MNKTTLAIAVTSHNFNIANIEIGLLAFSVVHLCELIVRDDKIVLPSNLQALATEWHHTHLLHPGEKRLEMTMRQHFTFIGLRPMVRRVCTGCNTCKRLKKRHNKCGTLPPKDPELIPWHTLCIDLIGPCTFGKKKNEVTLHCVTMIDPATGWFEIVEMPNRQADFIANTLEMTWLTRHPWPTEIIMDRARNSPRKSPRLSRTNVVSRRS